MPRIIIRGTQLARKQCYEVSHTVNLSICPEYDSIQECKHVRLITEQWLQTNWLQLRAEYVERRTRPNARCRTAAAFLKQYQCHMQFLETDQTNWKKLQNTLLHSSVTLDSSDDQLEFCFTADDLNSDDDEDPENVFQELSDVDADPDTTKCMSSTVKLDSNEEDINIIPHSKVAEVNQKTGPRKRMTTTVPVSISPPKKVASRCEDTIFGELVTAMLLRMEPAEKKRVKKEIMNLLL